METLVLNSAYMVVARVPWFDAVADLLNGRAEVVDCYEDLTVRSGLNPHVPRTLLALATEEIGVWRIPSIIRFLTRAVFNKRNSRRPVKFCRHNVWLRDNGRCQYCNVKLRTEEFTYDHVLPQSRGGKTRWENIVVACLACNHKKADRTPAEAKMRLLSEPTRPMQVAGKASPAFSWGAGMPTSWKNWLGSVDYWHGSLAE